MQTTIDSSGTKWNTSIHSDVLEWGDEIFKVMTDSIISSGDSGAAADKPE